jgi:hypothetical protein
LSRSRYHVRLVVEQLFAPNSRIAILPVRGGEFAPVGVFVLVGALFLRNPGESLLTLTSLAISELGWVLLSGIVGIVLVLELWASMPVAAAWLGCWERFGHRVGQRGFALAWLAWRVRQA